ncbi:uncharacterized protein N0V89_001688 [Didymosphaeria variabile]|uniref:Xylanolytic transcriptional activator regulatory domain-containing protein n=1 Tax=Didymosphaeria variabile TaxID=1932322 RepID=A0A9W8XWR7_9PLEO|nr:uncharacterized protein N0V89_001688 [Didymosphaeria variabile]KAJ4361119.1 hypothetical protein N0V89_001688 [Didymosphaeria variabile]
MWYGDLALQYIEEAFRECGDDAPPLVLLQALVLVTHQMLTRGVRGRAWRHLGTCVRVAYELNLHLLDSQGTSTDQAEDAAQWCHKEERRRTWWAIWEMDTFASTIRRCPTAVDWSQNETYLPVEDEHWFEGKAHPSCFLELELTNRWKVLLHCGNNSPKAWFIVVNSLMKEAQAISSPRGIYHSSNLERSARTTQSNGHEKNMNRPRRGSGDQLSTIYNSLRCFSLALPLHLKYRNQYLGFQTKAPGSIKSPRHLHSAIYSIHLMTQLTRFMIHHYRVFGGTGRSALVRKDVTAKASPARNDTSGDTNASHDTMAIDGYFEAADNILNIVDRSSDEHYRYMNPFLASTVWLAAAVQLVRKEFGSASTNKTLAKSKYEVLFLMYNQYVRYWNISTALGQNLDALEHQLGRFHESQQAGGGGGLANNTGRIPSEQRKQSVQNGSVEKHWVGDHRNAETDRRSSVVNNGRIPQHLVHDTEPIVAKLYLDDHTISPQNTNGGELLSSTNNYPSGAIPQNGTQGYPPPSETLVDPLNVDPSAPQDGLNFSNIGIKDSLSMMAPQTQDVLDLDGYSFDFGIGDSSTMLSSYLNELLSGSYPG